MAVFRILEAKARPGSVERLAEKILRQNQSVVASAPGALFCQALRSGDQVLAVSSWDSVENMQRYLDQDMTRDFYRSLPELSMGTPSIRTYDVIGSGDGAAGVGGAVVSWYYPKGWTDQEDGVEQVLIHYVNTPPGQWPDWSWGHESRVLEDRGGFPRTRLKVLRMPLHVWDLEHGYHTPEYRFHYFFEVFQNGHRWTTDLFSEDIVYRDLEYVDHEAWTTNICIYWSVGDWAAPVYSPMEDPRFPADSDYRATKYYSYQDKERFHHDKFHMLQAMERPHHWRSRMYGPRGATLVQQYHVGRMYPPHEKDEFWLGPDGRSAPGGDSWWTHHL